MLTVVGPIGRWFVGSSAFEVVADISLKPRLIATLKDMRAARILDFDIFTADLMKIRPRNAPDEVSIAHLRAAIRCLSMCGKRCRSQYAKWWYNPKLNEAQERLYIQEKISIADPQQQTDRDDVIESEHGAEESKNACR